MSIIGPRPGDDTADAGDREPPVKWDADSVDLTLELRYGTPDATMVCFS